MTTDALISFPQMYLAQYIDFNLGAKNGNKDKTLSSTIVDKDGVETFESVFYLPDGTKKQYLGQGLYPCDENLDINIPGPVNTAGLAMLSKNGADFCIRATTNDPAALFKRVGASSASITSYINLDDFFNEPDILQPAVDRAPYINMPDMLMTASCTLQGGSTNQNGFLLSFAREDGSSGLISLKAKETPVTDNYGNTYTHELIIDNMDGSTPASYDIAGNVWLNVFQISALYTNDTGQVQVDVDLAWGPNDYRCDAFRVLYSTLADTLRRGNYIIEGNTPDYAGQGGIDNYRFTTYKKIGDTFKPNRDSGEIKKASKKFDTRAFKKFVDSAENARRNRRFY